MVRRSFALTTSTLAALTMAAGPLEAQLIGIRTIPVAAGDQFLLVPSKTMGMGGVSIAIDDSLGDPFQNPAAGARLGESLVFGAPTFYSVTNHAGSARSLPVGALFGGRRWFGGGALALQQLRPGAEQFWAAPLLEADASLIWPGPQPVLKSQNNLYATGFLGFRLPGDKVAIGAGAFLADLNGMDGVEHLYGFAQQIDQFGSVRDLRLGLLASLAGGRSLEATVLHNRFRMTHDVTYVDWVLIDSTTWTWEPQTRVETNLDRTNTWGLHLRYTQPLASGWRVGAIFTGNRKLHPKIPNYDLMNIPRDPGGTWAYNVGAGVSRRSGPAAFALDVIYEPAWSHTWAEAEEPTPKAGGGTIGVGEMTVKNRFAFSNALVRMGVSRDIDKVGLALGLQVRAIDYELQQADLVAGTSRRQNESWMEWMPTWGMEVRFPEFRIAYQGRATMGTGRPGVAWGPATLGRAEDLAVATDIVVAPGAPLTLQEATVITHQFFISLPIR